MTGFRLDFLLLLPELYLSAATLLLLLFGVYLDGQNRTAYRSAPPLSIGGGLSLLLYLPIEFSRIGSAAAGFWGVGADPIGSVFRLLIVLATLLLLAGYHSLYRRDLSFPYEFPLLLLFSTIGYLFLVGSSNFLLLYLSLELSSFSLYLIAAIRRTSLFSTESGLKYFLLGGLSSGFILLATALLYLQGGTVYFDDWLILFRNWPDSTPLPLLPLALLLSGLLFKLSAAPFHLWAPDVYDGAPLPSTGYFASVSKIAILGLLVRLLYAPFSPLLPLLSPPLLLAGLLSLFVGTVGALGQRRLKRLIAYSGINHSGWLLLGVGAGSSLGLVAAVVYAAIYLLLTVNLFLLLLPLKTPANRRIRTLEELAPLYRSAPPVAAALSANLLSLAGIPPLAGFLAKFYVLLALLLANQVGVAVVAVVLAVASTVYYIRLLRILFFDRPLRWLLLRPSGIGSTLPLLLTTGLNLSLLLWLFNWLPPLQLL